MKYTIEEMDAIVRKQYCTKCQYRLYSFTSSRWFYCPRYDEDGCIINWIKDTSRKETRCGEKPEEVIDVLSGLI